MSDVSDRAKKYMEEVTAIVDRMGADLPAKIEEMVEALQTARRTGRRIYTCGNGGSASTASHMASDLNKGSNRPDAPRFRAVALTDNIPIMLAWANDSSYEDVFVEQLKNHVEAGDIVVGISGSGNSANVLKAIEHANNVGAVTIGLSGFDGGRLAKLANISYVVPSDCMQQVEDVHLMIEHLISLVLRDSPECSEG